MPVQWLGWAPQQRESPISRLLMMAGPMLAQYLMHQQRLGTMEKIAGARTEREEAGIERDMQDDYLDRLPGGGPYTPEQEAALREFGATLEIEPQRLDVAFKTAQAEAAGRVKEAKPALTAAQRGAAIQRMTRPPRDFWGRVTGYSRQEVMREADTYFGPIYEAEGRDWLDSPERAEFVRKYVDPYYKEAGEEQAGIRVPGMREDYEEPLPSGLVRELEEHFAPGVPGFRLPKPGAPTPGRKAPKRGVEQLEEKVGGVGPWLGRQKEKAAGVGSALSRILDPLSEELLERTHRGAVRAGTALNVKLAPLERALDELPGIGGWLQRPEPFYSFFGGKPRKPVGVVDERLERLRRELGLPPERGKRR